MCVGEGQSAAAENLEGFGVGRKLGRGRDRTGHFGGEFAGDLVVEGDDVVAEFGGKGESGG